MRRALWVKGKLRDPLETFPPSGMYRGSLLEGGLALNWVHCRAESGLLLWSTHSAGSVGPVCISGKKHAYKALKL